MKNKEKAIVESTLSNYSELLDAYGEKTKVVDFCAILHSFELELKAEIEDLCISREIKLTHQKLIVKVLLKNNFLNKKIQYLRSKNRKLCSTLYRLGAVAGFYDAQESRIHYYVLLPINDSDSCKEVK